MQKFLSLPETIQISILLNLTVEELVAFATTSKCCDVLSEKVAALSVERLVRLFFSSNILESSCGNRKFLWSQMTKKRILNFGGSFSEQSVVGLSLSTGNWLTLPESEHPRECFSAIHHRGFVHVISGEDDQALGVIETFNTVTEKWGKPSLFPFRTKHACCVPVGENLVVIGGEVAANSQSTTGMFSVPLEGLAGLNQSCAWKLFPESLSAPRKNHSAVYHGGRLWVAGGILRDNEITSSVETLDFPSDREAEDFFTLELFNKSSVGTNGTKVRTGVESGAGAGVGAVVETRKFEEAPAMIKKRRNFKLVVVGGDLFAVGGDEEGTIEKFDEEEDQWCLVTTLPTFRRNCSVTCSGDSIYVIGGQDRRRRAMSTYDVLHVPSLTWASGNTSASSNANGNANASAGAAAMSAKSLTPSRSVDSLRAMDLASAGSGIGAAGGGGGVTGASAGLVKGFKLSPSRSVNNFHDYHPTSHSVGARTAWGSLSLRGGAHAPFASSSSSASLSSLVSCSSVESLDSLVSLDPLDGLDGGAYPSSSSSPSCGQGRGLSASRVCLPPVPHLELPPSEYGSGFMFGQSIFLDYEPITS